MALPLGCPGPAWPSTSCVLPWAQDICSETEELRALVVAYSGHLSVLRLPLCGSGGCMAPISPRLLPAPRSLLLGLGLWVPEGPGVWGASRLSHGPMLART